METKRFNRRDFLKYAAVSGALFALGSIPFVRNVSDGGSTHAEVMKAVSTSPRNSMIAEENRKLGNRDWKLTQPADGRIQGYGSATSVNSGENITFYISTQVKGIKYQLNVYRLGWYQGAGARLVHSVKDLKGQAQGWWSNKTGRHGLPNPDPETKLLHLSWEPSYELKVPSDWVTGYYMVRLTDEKGFQSYIPFIVRDDQNQHDLMVQASVATWQAYSAWGGYGYYGHYDEKTHKYVEFNDDKENTAVVVSYNRPYEQENGAGDLFLEYPTIFWMESMGYDIGYVTNIDTHLSRMKWKPKAFISVGHDEYYSRPMRNYVTDLRDSGIHLAFLGANDMYWQIRFEDGESQGDAEPRMQVCYKYLAHRDPVKNTKLLTSQWNNLGEPENQVLGQMFGSVVYDFPDWEISNPDHWLFTGLHVKKSDRVKRLIGWEYDCVADNLCTPPNIEIISASTFINANNEQAVSNSTIYRHWSNAFVFCAGTIYWGFGLSNPMEDERGAVDDIIKGVTANLINKFIET